MQLSYDYAKDRALMCLRANYESHLWPCHVVRDSCGLAVPSRISIAEESGSGLIVVVRHSVRWGRGMHLAHAV